MQAVAIKGFGGPEVLQIQEISVPEPGPEEVRLLVGAAAVNPVDLGTRSGKNISEKDARFPMVIGWDVAGTVDAVGEGVDDWRVGDRVVAMSVQPVTQVGTYAEEVVLDAGLLAPYPDGTEDTEAATLPLAGLTALQALETLDLDSGQTLLVNGPLGAVGGFAVQLASRLGVAVVAPVREEEAERAQKLGAKFVIDRAGVVAAQTRETVPGGVDAAIDVVGAGTAREAFESVRDGGRYATTVPEWWIPGGPFHPERGIEPQVVGVRPNTDQLAELSWLLSGGDLRARVGHVLKLGEASRAHDLLETGGLHGKVVLVP